MDFLTGFIEHLRQDAEIEAEIVVTDGVCSLSFDNEFAVTIEEDAEGGRLRFFASLGQVPASPAPDIGVRLLHANLFWRGTAGATFGVDFTTRLIVMAQDVRIDLLDRERFQDFLEDFVNRTEDWRQEIAGWLEETKDEEPSRGPATMPFQRDGMIRT